MFKFGEKINPGFLVETTTAKNSKFDFNVGKGLLQDRMLHLKKIPLELGKEMAANFFTCSIQLDYLLFRISYLEPDIPLRRETTLKDTMKLHPYKEELLHRKIDNGNEIWKSVAENNFELHLFALGLILVDSD